MEPAEVRAAEERLRQSLASGADQFELTLKPEGKVELVTSYAKYLIEYLTGEFNRHPDRAAQPYNEGEEQPRRTF